MNNQQITERLIEDGWIQNNAYEHFNYKKGKEEFHFHFCAFELHEIILNGRTRFLGKIRTQTDYKSLMKMLEIK